jgi:hypothetical protein
VSATRHAHLYWQPRANATLPLQQRRRQLQRQQRQPLPNVLTLAQLSLPQTGSIKRRWQLPRLRLLP